MNSMPPVGPIEPIIPIAKDKSHDVPEFTQQTKNTVRKESDVFIPSYAAQIDTFLQGKNPDPRWAFDHIRHAGKLDVYEYMDACSIIYSWLYANIPEMDTKKVGNSIRLLIADLMNELISKDPIPDYKKLLEDLSADIERWYTQTIGIDRIHSHGHAQDPTAGASMPGAYADILKKIPKTSPLYSILTKA